MSEKIVSELQAELAKSQASDKLSQYRVGVLRAAIEEHAPASKIEDILEKAEGFIQGDQFPEPAEQVRLLKGRLPGLFRESPATVPANDPLAIGRNMEAIAEGRTKVI